MDGVATGGALFCRLAETIAEGRSDSFKRGMFLDSSRSWDVQVIELGIIDEGGRETQGQRSGHRNCTPLLREFTRGLCQPEPV